MTEAEWLAATPYLMMHHIKQAAPAPARKLRLLAVAWARFLESQPDYATARRVSHLGEEVVEGRKTVRELQADQKKRGGRDGDWSIANSVLTADAYIAQAVGWLMAFSEERGRRAGLDVSGRPAVARSLILCVLGNPFRPVAFDPPWRTDTALSLAQQMYDDKEFSPMPILADALQDAGCDSADILDHCRGAGPHARGCWVVDLVLGKE